MSTIESQSAPIEALRRALNGGRLHHAYLFAGPDGVGKALTAQALAEALLCETPLEMGDACGQCNTCLRTKQRQHPDLHIVQRGRKKDGSPEQQIKIDQIRTLQQALSYKAYEAHRRVVILLDAHAMNPATANALLKTLEEPGPNTHFILVSAAPHLLLPTILSRCQRVRFGPLPRNVVARHLAEKAGLEPEMADLLAGLAEGSIGRGLEIAESPVLAERLSLIEGIDDPEGIHKVPILIDLAESLARRKPDLPLVFQVMRSWFRDVLLVQTGMPAENLVHRDLLERLQQRAEGLTGPQVLERLAWVSDAEQAIAYRSANARMVLETMCLKLAMSHRSSKPAQRSAQAARLASAVE
ncbi:MAG: DNA polymerase III subunit delta' [Bradymonadia bacterium]